MNDSFANKTLLITGGTGSFGNALLSRVIKNNSFSEIRIFSRDEKKQDDMRRKYNIENVKFFLGDVRDKSSLESCVQGVDYIFHAAALKQVPSCEFFPIEAVKTNILGTENVLDLAEKNKVKKVVVLSTDKAAYPINAMGMSKSLMEKVVIAKSRLHQTKSTIFCCTRYGNVIASRGSVLPLFLKQIKSGKSITVTNPEMTRFIMSLDEAVDLVMYAFKHGKQGELFVQKSPACTIKSLAEAMVILTGKSKTKIEIIGSRHGEKLYETLVTREEMANAKEVSKYFKITPDFRTLNYESYFSEGNKLIDDVEEYNSNNTKILETEEVVKLLEKLDILELSLN